MSSSSRVMASNYLNAKIYYKNLYYQIKPTESICSVCSNRSHSIRTDTCCYNCLEKNSNLEIKLKAEIEEDLHLLSLRDYADLVDKLINF